MHGKHLKIANKLDDDEMKTCGRINKYDEKCTEEKAQSTSKHYNWDKKEGK